MGPPCLQHGTFQSSKRPLTIGAVLHQDMRHEGWIVLWIEERRRRFKRPGTRLREQRCPPWEDMSIAIPFAPRVLKASYFTCPYAIPTLSAWHQKRGARGLVFRFFLHVVYIYIYTNAYRFIFYCIILHYVTSVISYQYIISYYNMVYHIVIVYYCSYHDCYIKSCCIILYYITLYYVISHYSIGWYSIEYSIV